MKKVSKVKKSENEMEKKNKSGTNLNENMQKKVSNRK